MDDALRRGLICYFQLPTMYAPFLAEACGKLVLQCLQGAVARRHLSREKGASQRFFSVFLDDFQDYIYEGFASLLNKSRSANIGVVFSHQALGDLDKVSPAFRNVVLTNTNIKCVMRINDPDTAEYFSKSFGTRSAEKRTDRRVASLLGEVATGEGSVREVEEFVYHPNVIKTLRLGEGLVSIPHPKGVRVERIRFQRRPDLPRVELPSVPKTPFVMPRHPGNSVPMPTCNGAL